MPKEFTYRGKTLEELQNMSLQEFVMLIPSRERRSLKRSIPATMQKVLKKMRLGITPRTHSREIIIIPEMVGKKIKVHNGKNFEVLEIQPEMLGCRLGEYIDTRKRVHHSDPGIGATRASKFVAMK